MHSGQILKRAFEILKKNWVVAVALLAISTIVSNVCTTVYDYLNVSAYARLEAALASMETTGNWNTLTSALLSFRHGWLQIVGGFFSLLFPLSIASSFLGMVRTEKLSFSDFFGSWKRFLQSILISIIQAVAIGIGLILFIIPGIYLALAYSQVYYVKADNPELSIGKCFTRSRELMKGRKSELISLYFSLILWYIGLTLAITFLETILFFIGSGLVIDLVYTVLSVLFTAIVTAYETTALALFYEHNVKNPVSHPRYHYYYNPFNSPNQTGNGSAGQNDASSIDPFSDVTGNNGASGQQSGDDDVFRF